MNEAKLSPWEAFKNSDSPIAKPREIVEALKPNGPYIDVLYREFHAQGTMLGVKPLRIGRRILVPRKMVIEVLEGTEC